MSSSRPADWPEGQPEPAAAPEAIGRGERAGEPGFADRTEASTPPHLPDQTSTATDADSGEQEDAARRPVHVSMTRVVAVGMGLWAVALVVTLVVPDLRTGDRSWWPWCAAAGIALGALGLAYLSVGRGNAADA